MAAKLFSSRLVPMDEWVLIRIPQEASSVLMAEMGPNGKVRTVEGGTRRNNTGIVVSFGPGRTAEDGKLIPIDERIKVGVTVIFPGKVGLRIPDFEKEMMEEGLLFIPASTVVSILLPQGERAPAFALKA